MGPIASKLKAVVDGVYRAQKYGRRFKTPVHELNELVEQVNTLEQYSVKKEVAPKTKEVIKEQK